MNGSTHELVTKKAIEFLNSIEPGITVAGGKLSSWSQTIASANSATDSIRDLEFVDVEGIKNTGRDNPHKKETGEIDDVPRYKETRLGFNMELTAMNHFIDIRKGAGTYDDYDGYSYQRSAKNGQHEKQTGQYIDDAVNYWYNDEYVHAPGQEYYQNCSPSVWRYSFPKGKNLFADKYAELKSRFPLAEWKGVSGKGIPYSTFMPVDNLGRYWYETFLLSGNIAYLGRVLHAIQDAAVPLHAAGYLGNWHRKYESDLEAYGKTYMASSNFRTNATRLYNSWKSISTTYNSVRYETDANRTPGIKWRTDALITWVAFQAFREYVNTYSSFKSYSKLNNTSAAKLFDYAGAMSMLLLKKAGGEYQSLIPPSANRVRTITLSVKTRNVSDADTDDDIALHVSSHNLEGGALELAIKDIPNVDELERGRTDTYTLDVGTSSTIDDRTMKLTLQILGRDGWLPETFNISYKTADGKSHTYTSGQTWNTWFTSTHPYYEIPRIPEKKYVTGIRVVANISSGTAKSKFGSEYFVITKDLNKSSGGSYIYLGYKIGEPGMAPITCLTLVESSKSQSWKSKTLTAEGISATFYRIDVDLNKGSGGRYIYLCYTYDTRYKPLAGIDVVFSGETTPSGYKIINWAGTTTNANVNKGSGGKAVYIAQRR